MSWLLVTSLKVTLLLSLAGLVAALLRKGTAAARHQVWSLGVAGALLVPLLCLALPSVPVSATGPTGGAGRVLEAAATLASAGAPVPGDTGSSSSPWATWLAAAWAAGALLVALRFARAHGAAWALARTAAPVADEAWRVASREAAAALAMRDEVGLGLAPGISSPMTVGVRRPRVLLPDATESWSPERRRAILIHELGHVRRRDTLLQLAAQLACALYWWNPLVWLAAARLRVERELACDDLVLHAGVRPSSYAADLLDVACGLGSRGDTACAATIAMADGSRTEGRLRRILDVATPRRPPGRAFRATSRGTALAVAAFLGLVSSPLPAAKEGPVWLGKPGLMNRAAGPFLEPIDLAGFAKGMARQEKKLTQCYTRRLADRPGLKGALYVHWVSVGGMIFPPTIDMDTLADPEVRSCVEQVVGKAKLPAATGGQVDVVMTISFGEPADDC